MALKVLFKARLEGHRVLDGEWDYFCEGGVGYRDDERSKFSWTVINGTVMFRSLSGFTGESNGWAPDSPEVQRAYNEWLAKLVTEDVDA